MMWVSYDSLDMMWGALMWFLMMWFTYDSADMMWGALMWLLMTWFSYDSVHMLFYDDENVDIVLKMNHGFKTKTN